MGFDLKLFETAPEREILCTLCKKVLENPRLLCKEGHNACETCIDSKTLICPICTTSRNTCVNIPNRLAQHLLQSRTCVCIYARYGCAWKGALSNVQGHIVKCTFHPMKCLYPRCNAKMRQKRTKFHSCFCQHRPWKERTHLCFSESDSLDEYTERILGGEVGFFTRWEKQAIEKEDAGAQNNLGLCYHYGIEVDENDELAKDWFQRAANQGYSAAQCNLYSLQSMEDVYDISLIQSAYERNYPTAMYQMASYLSTNKGEVALLTKLAQQGNTRAQSDLGYIYSKDCNVQDALKWYTLAAERGYIVAQYKLAVEYEKQGNTNQRNYWLQYAAIQEDPVAQKMLGVYYYKTSNPPNRAEAEKWMERSALHDDIQAQHLLAKWYSTDEYLLDKEKAKFWCLKLESNGDADSQAKLADVYYLCEEFEKARYWYEQSAKQGQRDAQYDLAIMYMNGTGGIRDFDKSEHWLRQAANQGDVDAQYELSRITFYPASKVWLTRAAENGFAQAMYQLGTFYKDRTTALQWFVRAADNGYEYALHSVERTRLYSFDDFDGE